MIDMKKIIQLTSGRGPAECNYVLTNVLKKFLQICEKNQVQVEVFDREIDSDFNLITSVILSLEADDLNHFLMDWIGTIQWIGKSPYRKIHARKNWFIGCFELEIPKTNPKLEKEFVYQTMRSSGNGGQNVNKVNSAVRITHPPTGLSVVSMDSRSQHQNKKIATMRMLLKLEALVIDEKKNLVKAQWQNQTAIQRGNPVKVFRGEKFL